MSILQEYQEHEKILGRETIAKICEYIEECNKAGKELFYSDVVYKRTEYEKFEKWLKTNNSK